MRTWLVRKDTGKPKERIRVANVYRIHPPVGALKIEAHLLFPHCSRVARVEQSADLCVGKATRDSLGSTLAARSHGIFAPGSGPIQQRSRIRLISLRRIASCSSLVSTTRHGMRYGVRAGAGDDAMLAQSAREHAAVKVARKFLAYYHGRIDGRNRTPGTQLDSTSLRLYGLSTPTSFLFRNHQTSHAVGISQLVLYRVHTQKRMLCLRVSARASDTT